MTRLSLIGLTPGDIADAISPSGYGTSEARTVATAFYRKRISSTDEIKGISGRLKRELKEIFVEGLTPPVASALSDDGSIKYLFGRPDGNGYEAVYIPDGKRHTVCVSTQSGCRMGCPFCATGQMGFRGNLSAGEIMNQVLSIPQTHSVTHVVFMGMGEPLDNIAEVIKACRILTADWGMALSCRNVTVSTVGISGAVSDFLEESDCNLTLSLFSPFPEERERIIPAERGNRSAGILQLMKSQPLRKGRRLSIAYVMMKGINDTDRHLEGLKNLLAGSGVRVNLLSYHNAGLNEYIPSSADRLLYFKHELVTAGISASVRKSRGQDISAACGLLASGISSGQRG